MHVLRWIALSLLALLVAGCGSSGATESYNAANNQMIYETRSYTVSQVSGANFASSKSITMRAIARCSGQNCTPQQVQLVFSASGNSTLTLSSAAGEIVADGQRVEWSSKAAGRPQADTGDDEMINVVGTFATVDLSLSELKQIANASSVEGSIGGTSLNISESIQSGFQSLLMKIQNGTTGERAASESRP